MVHNVSDEFNFFKATVNWFSQVKVIPVESSMMEVVTGELHMVAVSWD